MNKLVSFAGDMRLRLCASRSGSYLKSCIGGLVPAPVTAFDTNTPHFDPQPGIFRFRGSDKEIGVQFADAFRLEEALARSEMLLHVDGGEGVRLALALLERWAPSHLEFLRGIAACHVGHCLETVVHAAFSTILMKTNALNSCSSLSFCDHGKPVVGQNLDLGRNTLVALACLVPERGIARMARVNLGYPWLCTFINAAGLVASSSSTNVNRPNRANDNLLPQELIFEIILSQAKSTKEAVDLLTSLPSVGPLNGGVSAIFADVSGDTRHVEITGLLRKINDDVPGAHITTNHFRHPAMANLNRHDDWMSKRLEAGSVARYDHAVNALAAEGGPTVAWLRKLLRTEGDEGAWLRKARWPDLGYTTASYLVDLKKNELEFWLGSEAEHSRHVTLADCFGNAAGDLFRSESG